MWHAIAIACVCEFSGAMLLGARTTDTIRSGIVSPALYVGHEDLLMFGMLSALSFTGVWLFAMSRLEINVSTTHSLIGSIIGFALCTPAGGNAVKWEEVGKIVASWFASPVLAGCISATLFWLTRRFILRHENGPERALVYFPFLGFFTMFVNAFFVMYNGGITTGKGLSRINIPPEQSVGWAALIAFIFALIIGFVVNPMLRRYVGSMTDDELQAKMYGLAPSPASTPSMTKADQPSTNEFAIADSSAPDEKPAPLKKQESLVDRMFHQSYIHESIQTNEKVAAIHKNGETFHIRTEFTFGYLQIMTASFASFAHGSSDVANYVGPLAAINAVYRGGSIKPRSPVEDWLLVVGASGLLFGLALYGHKLIAAFGVKAAKITPSRGYAIELAAALIVVTASFLSIPISTSHAFVGSIVGVALMEENKSEAVNKKLLLTNVMWWFLTLVLCGTISATIFSWSTFAPSQIYPLNRHNCITYYSVLRNATKDGAFTRMVDVDSAGLVRGLVGFPVNGTVVALP